MKLLAALALTLACSADSQAGRAGSLAAHTGLRLASFNLNFGVAGAPADNVAAIAATNADVVVFQESTDAWEAAITGDAALAARYPVHRFAPPPGAFGAGGMGIVSRYTIASIDELPPTSHGIFFAWRIVVATPTANIQILDVHLRPPMSDRGSWVVGFFTTGPDRGKELAAHVAALDPALPTIIAGDFNDDGGDALHLLAADHYTDAIAQFHGADHTWRWPMPGGGELRFQLDHMFYDRRFTAHASEILDAGTSDHLPIDADLTLR